MSAENVYLCDKMSITVDTIDFAGWLQDELDKRDWSQADLARHAGIHRQVVNTYINRQRIKPDEDVLAKIASALKLPLETVYRAAGILPELPSRRQAAEEILGYKLSELTEEEIDDLLIYIEFIQAKRGKESDRKTREGKAPPETVKGKR